MQHAVGSLRVSIEATEMDLQHPITGNGEDVVDAAAFKVLGTAFELWFAACEQPFRSVRRPKAYRTERSESKPQSYCRILGCIGPEQDIEPGPVSMGLPDVLPDVIGSQLRRQGSDRERIKDQGAIPRG
jgi:hypothetical protein